MAMMDGWGSDSERFFCLFFIIISYELFVIFLFLIWRGMRYEGDPTGRKIVRWFCPFFFFRPGSRLIVGGKR